MKNLGPAFLAAAAMLCALTIAIAREHLGKYEWAVPYLGGMIALCIILGVVSLVVTGRQQDKRRDLSTPPPPRNRHHEQRVTQEANPQQNVYFGQEFLRQFREPQPPKQSFKPEPVEPEPNLQPGSPEYVSVVLNATGTWTEAPIKAYVSRAR